MLPALANKLDKLSSKSKKSSKKKSKHKSKAKSSKSKKSSKKKRKKHKHSSSSSSDSDSDSDSSTSSSSSSSDSDRKQRSRHKKVKKNRKRSGSSADKWVESAPAQALVQRDSWMTDSAALMLKTYSKERKEPAKPNEKLQQIDAYDPAKSCHELNPYWKSNGTGLPSFQKPKADEDEDEEDAQPASHARAMQQPRGSTRSWQKPGTVKDCGSSSRSKRSPSPANSDASSGEESETEQTHLTDEQINELAAKAIKAELKGKPELAAELNKQLETARKQRTELLASGKAPAAKPSKSQQRQERDHVLLTRTDASGNVRPLVQSRSAAAQADPNALYGGRKGQKRAQKKVDTHVDGQRVRYFADDDRYDIKQMVIRNLFIFCFS